VTAELYMDYLDPVNTMTTHLPARITRPLIYRKKFRISEWKNDNTKG
jgi:hypothetical protein